MDEPRGFLNTLLDTSFSSFITAKFIRVLYILVLLLGVAMAFFYLFGLTATLSGFMNGFIAFILAIPLAAICTALWVVFMRIWLEIVIVIFRMAENMQFLADRARMGGSGGASPAGGADLGGL
jgi:Domain of unknown function (DUF4282)